jgi:hypothetical protein
MRIRNERRQENISDQQMHSTHTFHALSTMVHVCLCPKSKTMHAQTFCWNYLSSLSHLGWSLGLWTGSRLELNRFSPYGVSYHIPVIELSSHCCVLTAKRTAPACPLCGREHGEAPARAGHITVEQMQTGSEVHGLQGQPAPLVQLQRRCSAHYPSIERAARFYMRLSTKIAIYYLMWHGNKLINKPKREEAE